MRNHFSRVFVKLLKYMGTCPTYITTRSSPSWLKHSNEFRNMLNMLSYVSKT